MGEWAYDLLRESAVLRLFLVVSIGFLIGEIKFPGNFRLGLAAVLFTGLAFGAMDPSFVLPADVQTIGLVLFVYCVGLEAGPGFLQSLRKDGVRLNAAVLGALLAGAAVLLAAAHLTEQKRHLLVGLFCGALTNTAALGAATETIFRSGGDAAMASAAVVGFGISYPVGMIIVLTLLHLRGYKKGGEGSHSSAPNTMPRAQTLLVKTSDGSQPWKAEGVEQQTGVVLTRVKTAGGKVSLVSPGITLSVGEQVVAVGTPAALQAALNLLGAAGTERLEENLQGFEVHRYFVSNSTLAGKPVGALGLEKYGAVLSRLRRGDVDLPVSDQTVLRLGDRVRIITYKENEPTIRKLFGNSLTALTENGYFTFGLGIALGIILGAVPVPVPGLAEPIRLGFAGGPLIAGLALGYVGRSGPFIWHPPLPVTLTLRHVGILFFLACAGVKAGSVLPGTLQSQGATLIPIAAAVALAAHLSLWAILALGSKLPIEKILGTNAGLQTQPAALSFLTERLNPGPVNLSYATSYPLATILKILLAQLLLAI